MPADLSLSQADAEDLGISLIASLLSAVQADRLLAHIKAEPARLAAARAEGVRDGIEKAAQWHDQRAAHFDRPAGGPRDLAVAVATQHRGYAASIRALSPAPAEPSAPTREDE